jgi:small subunit ribosomal protein S2
VINSEAEMERRQFPATIFMEKNIGERTVSIKLLLEAGVHFGHQTRYRHPHMKPYIFTQRRGIYIIDLEKTLVLLEEARNFIRDVAARGEDILFVGTKRQAQESVEQGANRCGAFYVNQRWVGGMLTNFSVIQSRIDYLVRLEDRKERGEFEVLPKKEVLKLEKKIDHLNRLFGGIKEMTRMPGCLFVVDLLKGKSSVAEAKKVGIPVIAIVDTNCDPEIVDYPIPANDDAVKAIRLISNVLADAVLEGRASLEETTFKEPSEALSEAEKVAETTEVGEHHLEEFKPEDSSPLGSKEIKEETSGSFYPNN